MTYGDHYRQFPGCDSGKSVNPNENIVALKYNDRVRVRKNKKNKIEI